MRVAMVSEHASPLAVLGGEDAGGQNVHVAALATATARRGAEVIVYTRRDNPSLADDVQLAPGVTVRHLKAGPVEPLPKDELLPHMPELAAGLADDWRERPPDVVHGHFWMSGHAALMAARPVGIPVVQTFHALGVVKRRYQGDADRSPPERLEIERGVIRGVDHVIATCTDEVFELLRLGASGERLTVIPCGVDLELFGPHRDPDPRTNGMHRLVCVARLVERKGVGNVITALAELPSAELVIAGGPERRDLCRHGEARRLRRIAREVGVNDRVHLLGRVERADVPGLIRSADTVVCAPWYEPFGIVPLEAMACGVPVVASAVGGMIDTVVDGLTGVHVPPRDPVRLAQALSALLADEERRRAYGRAGAERASRLYDWNRVAGSTLDVYARLTRASRPRLRLARAGGKGNGAFVLPPEPRDHLGALVDSRRMIEAEIDHISAWGGRLAAALLAGSRLLVAGNGGSAAQAQHLSAELVGRYHAERRPFSAHCLHGDTSSLTAISNDYGFEESFARQVRAHGRPGDVLLVLSTSGRSRNLVVATEAANEAGLHTWALTGPKPNPLTDVCDEVLGFDAPTAAIVQELHLTSVHMLCAAVDREVALRSMTAARELRA